MIHPWQQQVLSRIRNSEVCVWSVGRRSGKSQITQYMAAWQEVMGEKYPYKKITQAPVDGVMWYTVRCNSEVAKWLRDSQNSNAYYAHQERNWFDVSEVVYIQMGLRFL